MQRDAYPLLYIIDITKRLNKLTNFMISINKRRKPPVKIDLSDTHVRESVASALGNDQHFKCYICERKCITDYQVEHLRCKSKCPSLKHKWSNLFLSCGYCNVKKSHKYNHCLNPARQPIERIIDQSIDMANARAVFTPLVNADTAEVKDTLSLLNAIYNGDGKHRSLREQRFFDYTCQVIANFRAMLRDWLECPSESNRIKVSSELQMDKECLAFKYHDILTNISLYREFASLLPAYCKAK